MTPKKGRQTAMFCYNLNSILDIFILSKNVDGTFNYNKLTQITFTHTHTHTQKIEPISPAESNQRK